MSRRYFSMSSIASSIPKISLPERRPCSLEGQKLLVLAPWKISNHVLVDLQKQFPGLEINVRSEHWDPIGYRDGAPDIRWDDVTALVTGSCFPPEGKAPNLRYVQLLSAGANFLMEKPLFKDPTVRFCTANGVHGTQIAEWVIATFLMAQRRLLQYWQFQQESKWRRLEATDDANEQRVGILGYGSIGRQVARVCKALGMSVHAYTLNPRTTPESRLDTAYIPGKNLGDPDGSLPDRWYSGGSTPELHEFLASGLDLLVVCTPLTEKTRHLISEPEFEILAPKGTFVSNISRGGIINTDHLKAALDSDKIRGAAIDVTDPEPLPDGHPLWTTKNLIITPHVSGASTCYMDHILRLTQINLEKLSRGEPMMNELGTTDGY